MSGGWLPRQSLLLLIAAALILPVAVAIAVGFSAAQTERQRFVEREAMSVARRMIDSADAEVAADLRILHIFGYSQVLATRDWRGVEQLAKLALDANPSWKSLVVRDIKTGKIYADVGDPDNGDTLRPAPVTISHGGFAEGAFREGRHCPCVILHRKPAQNPDLLLTLYVKPEAFQGLMMKRVEPGVVAALVDQEGRFLARSMSYRERVGTPATIFVRKAVGQGGDDFYEGRTFEGFENYTAYSTSALTGWSAHLAVDRNWIDGPKHRSAWAIVLALISGLVLAIALLVYAAQDARVRRRDHARLLELQKSETIAEFTSIVVHDMRNLLATSYAGLNQIERHTHESETKRNIELVRDVVRRGEKLINRLLSFARGEADYKGFVDLKVLLEGLDELLRRLLGGGIRFNWEIEPDAQHVIGNSDKLELALINLARNAKEAMNGKGSFSISSSRSGEMAELIVDDDGPGVPAADRVRVFEAFYSTKASGKGTGLGLAQVAGSIRQAEGRISLEERPGGGARFRILLPLASRDRPSIAQNA